MKITELRIRNYKSIKDQSLTDLGDLVIITGPNSSGKTTLLEGLDLFFSEFSATGGTTEGLTPRLWHKTNQNVDIEFIVNLTFTAKEFETFDLSDLPKGLPSTLEIHRTLSASGAWSTQKVKAGNATLVSRDTFPFLKTETTKPQPLIVIPPPAGTVIASSGFIPVSTDITKYTRVTQDVEPKNLIGNEAREIARLATRQHQLNEQLTKLVKGRFKLIPAVRGVQSVGKNRAPQVPAVTLEAIKTLGLSEKFNDMASFGKFKQDLPKSFPGTFGVRPDYLYVERESIRFPVEYIGGGHQERLELQALIREEDFIFGLEEPEIHQHPDSARDLFGFLKEQSKSKQIFITTHSPIFVDRSNINGVYLSRLDGLETKFSQPKEWSDILNAIGANPSDNFVPDLVILVEGESDREYIKGLAESPKLDIQNIRICPTHGKSKSRYNLDAWQEVADGSQVRLFLFLDQSAKDDILEMVKNRTVDSDDYILLAGDLEDTYPEDLLKAALHELFQVDFVDELYVPPRVQTIEKRLKTMNKLEKDWKIKVARAIAPKVQKNDLPIEFTKLLDMIKGYATR